MGSEISLMGVSLVNVYFGMFERWKIRPQRTWTSLRRTRLRSTTVVRSIGGASAIVLIASGVFGQSAQPPRAFEVAAVKLHEGSPNGIDQFSSSGARANYRAYPMADLVREAYDLKDYQVSFVVPQPGDIYYDIFAEAGGDVVPTRSEFRQMLQALLADRFKLKVHTAKKQMPVYALVVGKNGPKFKKSAPDAVSSNLHGMNRRNYVVTQTKATMEDLAQDMSYFGVDRPVVDKTGLTGTYDYRLEATPESRIDNNPELSDIRVFTAVQEQLGLKLVSQKAPVEVLVVDHMEKPSEN
jgi:uncharacterized protein (TIGR03435 family)